MNFQHSSQPHPASEKAPLSIDSHSASTRWQLVQQFGLTRNIVDRTLVGPLVSREAKLCTT